MTETQDKASPRWLPVLIAEQESKYGPFGSDLREARLGLAVLQDELDEAVQAYQDERWAMDWAETMVEVRQIAGVAVRLADALERREAV